MSLVKRISFAFIANFFKSGFSFLTGILIARNLGAENYGIFSFLIASFIAFKIILDMGSSTAFFSFISKKKQTRMFFISYILWVFIQFLLILGFIALLAPNDWVQKIWLGEDRYRVLIAFIAVYLQTHIWLMVTQIGESQRLTVKVQSLNLGIYVSHFFLISILIFFDSLTIENIFYLVVLEFIIALIIAYLVFPLEFSSQKFSFSDSFIEYKKYCIPLIPYAWLGMFSEFIDRWLLQNYGGPIEQAYLSIALHFTGIGLLITNPIMNIIWKEFSEANEKKNISRVNNIFNISSKVVFFTCTVTTFFFIPWSEQILLNFLGPEYLDGTLVFAIMLLYPIHQTFGRIVSIGYYSLELTKEYVFIRSIGIVLGMIITYLLIAPKDLFIPGLGLASLGLACKMVFVQMFNCNIEYWYFTRKIKIRYEFIFQVQTFIFILCISYFSFLLIEFLMNKEVYFIYKMILSFVIYIFLCIILVFNFPSLIGIHKVKFKEIKKYIYG